MTDPGNNDVISEGHVARLEAKPAQRLWLVLTVITLLFITFWGWRSAQIRDFDHVQFMVAFGVGIAAQLVDGALGMAYGVTANSLLLAGGLSPAAATASVHVAEAFTTAASGLSHWRLGNIDKRIFGRIVLPGVIGGVAGVLLISSVDSRLIRPWIAAYLLVMGLYIIYRAFYAVRNLDLTGNRLVPVALFGGFADSVGGGGWGPIVTTTLLGAGHEPRMTIGSVNAAEFFVTLASGFSFALLIGIQTFESVAGLVAGGVLIAPFAARLSRHVPKKPMMVLVGLLVVSLSLFTIIKSISL